jgi:hypothetical protein
VPSSARRQLDAAIAARRFSGAVDDTARYGGVSSG